MAKKKVFLIGITCTKIRLFSAVIKNYGAASQGKYWYLPDGAHYSVDDLVEFACTESLAAEVVPVMAEPCDVDVLYCLQGGA